MARATATKNLTETPSTDTNRIINGVKLELIPMPGAALGRPANSKYPFSEMKLGESFEIVGDKSLNNVRNAMSKYSVNHPEYRFATRTVGERQENGQTVKVYRCWRIEAKVNG
jgi:hypothetical protein